VCRPRLGRGACPAAEAATPATLDLASQAAGLGGVLQLGDALVVHVEHELGVDDREHLLVSFAL
jgi:hypothetical protein